MKTPFLDYYKLILDKVSFDQQLLMKEYRKALNVLTEQEAFDLQQWLSTNGYHPGLPDAFREASTDAVPAGSAVGERQLNRVTKAYISRRERDTAAF